MKSGTLLFTPELVRRLLVLPEGVDVLSATPSGDGRYLVVTLRGDVLPDACEAETPPMLYARHSRVLNNQPGSDVVFNGFEVIG